MRKVLVEASLVGVLGLAMAFGANALSRHGLKLTRNYSPGHAVAAGGSAVAGAGVGSAEVTNATGNGTQLETQLRAEGLQFADGALAEKLFSDPKKGQELVIFVDARDDEHYQAGHIPGAYQLDHYHPENYLAEVLPACQSAEKIVVYCKGGSCEDSEQTALLLGDSSGIPKTKLFVYIGGFDEWSAHHQPIELGQRNSGRLLEDSSPATVSPAGAR
jgi:rhodanese-related sulfurtransferase